MSFHQSTEDKAGSIITNLTTSSTSYIINAFVRLDYIYLYVNVYIE